MNQEFNDTKILRSKNHMTRCIINLLLPCFHVDLSRMQVSINNFIILDAGKRILTQRNIY